MVRQNLISSLLKWLLKLTRCDGGVRFEVCEAYPRCIGGASGRGCNPHGHQNPEREVHPPKQCRRHFCNNLTDH